MKVHSIDAFRQVSSAKNLKHSQNRYLSYSTEPQQPDSVSFKSKIAVKKVLVPLEKAKFVGKSLSTSTSGHRAPYLSENFTKEIVSLITAGVGAFAITEAEKRKNVTNPTVLIGGDTRKASRESLPEIQKTLTDMGVDVININNPVPTPLLALAAQKKDVDLAVLMTASHNPWADGGYNLVTKAGAIAPAGITQQVASRMYDFANIGTYAIDKENKATVQNFNPYEIYKQALEDSKLIDWQGIKDSGIKVYYDGLQGTGENVMPRLMSDYGINYAQVFSTGQEGPNPTDKNLTLLKESVKNSDSKLKIGLANDGDADRFGVVDEKGNFVNANDVILLVGYHLAKNKGKTGAIIRSQATSKMLDVLADKYGLEKYETPVGFKYIAEDIMALREHGKDILVAGEESGGLTVNGHIPEKDGIIALSLIMDLVATEQRPLSQILKQVKEDLGVTYLIDNFSKKVLDDNAKNEMMKKIENIYDEAVAGKVEFGEKHRIDTDKTIALRKSMESYRQGGDGIKLVLTDGSTVLLRKSGTEPLVKCYIEASGKTPEEAEENRVVLHKLMDKFFEE